MILPQEDKNIPLISLVEDEYESKGTKKTPASAKATDKQAWKSLASV